MYAVLSAAILAITLSGRSHASGWKRSFAAPALLAATALGATGAARLLHASRKPNDRRDDRS